MHLQNLTFDQAIIEAARARQNCFVGISIFHQHEYDKIEADEGCYSIHAYTKPELAALRIESELPDEPVPQFEVLRNYVDDDDRQCGEVIYCAETLDDLRASILAGTTLPNPT